MDIERLKIFKKVAELNSFTKAAEELFMTQPSISKNIKLVEDYYGVSLFNRSGNLIKLTESGRKLLNYADDILKLAEEAKNILRENFNEIEEKIILGAGSTFGANILPGILNRFLRINPNMHFTIEISNAKKVIEKYSKGQIDIGIVGAIIERSDLNYYPFVTEKLQLIVSKHHPWAKDRNIPVSMLKNEPFFLREKGSGLRFLIEERLLASGIELKNVTELPNNEAIVKLVEAGLGVSIVPENAIANDIKTKNILTIEIKDVNLEHHYYLIYHEEKTKALKKFLDHLMLNYMSTPLNANFKETGIPK